MSWPIVSEIAWKISESPYNNKPVGYLQINTVVWNWLQRRSNT